MLRLWETDRNRGQEFEGYMVAGISGAYRHWIVLYRWA